VKCLASFYSIFSHDSWQIDKNFFRCFMLGALCWATPWEQGVPGISTPLALPSTGAYLGKTPAPWVLPYTKSNSKQFVLLMERGTYVEILNQSQPAHHGGWMVFGQETLFH
jgi:hypothetical protein